MTETAAYLFAAFGILAVGNWISVYHRRKALEYFFKPAALLTLIGAAATLTPQLEEQRAAFVVALAFSLAGDVFLMLPRDRFVLGLSSFFLAHVAYIIGLRMADSSVIALIAGVAAVIVVAATVGRRILASVRTRAPDLAAPVAAYIAVISVMVAAAIATENPWAASGAVIFMASDTLIAWNRFVQPMRQANVAIMVTYHLGQAALVVSLIGPPV